MPSYAFLCVCEINMCNCTGYTYWSIFGTVYNLYFSTIVHWKPVLVWIMLRDLVCSRAISRIVHESMYRNKLWPQYQSILHISTQNKSFTPSVLLSVEPYLWFLRKVSHVKLGLFENSTWCFKHPIEWLLHSLAPLPLLFPFSQQHSALLVCECLFCFCWMVDCCVEWLFPPWCSFWLSFWCAHVGSVLSSTYRCLRTSAVLMVLVLKVPQYHGVYPTTVSTLFHYFVVRTVLMVMSSTGSATVPWRLPYNSATTVLLFHPALSRRIVQYSQYFLLLSFSCILQEVSFLLSC